MLISLPKEVTLGQMGSHICHFTSGYFSVKVKVDKCNVSHWVFIGHHGLRSTPRAQKWMSVSFRPQRLVFWSNHLHSPPFNYASLFKVSILSGFLIKNQRTIPTTSPPSIYFRLPYSNQINKPPTLCVLKLIPRDHMWQWHSDNVHGFITSLPWAVPKSQISSPPKLDK